MDDFEILLPLAAARTHSSTDECNNVKRVQQHIGQLHQ
jgi:hypothetical protein